MAPIGINGFKAENNSSVQKSAQSSPTIFFAV